MYIGAATVENGVELSQKVIHISYNPLILLQGFFFFFKENKNTNEKMHVPLCSLLSW